MEFKDSYLGNPLVKRDGVETTFTKEQMVEYAKCMQSPAYFAETYIKIISLDKGLIPFKLYDYQRDMFKHFNTNRFNIVLACRQSGKSISSVAYLLWYAMFHPEKTVFILANKHATAKEMLARLTLMLENVPFWLQPGCKGLNKTDAHFSNNSKIIAASTSSNSIRGMTANLIFLDEFAFVEKAAEFYTSTYPVISSGESSRVIITSTANGIGNQYHKLWEGAKQRTNSYVPFQIDWWNVPGRDEKWKEETIANTSQLQFDQEFGNTFFGTGDTLINANTLMGLRAENPKHIEEDGLCNIYADPVKGHEYVMLVDVCRGKEQDYSTFSMIDISVKPFLQVAVYRNNAISPILFPQILEKYGKLYNMAYIVIENNDQGSLTCYGLHHDLEYENLHMTNSMKSDAIGIDMNKKTKKIGCSGFKDLLENNKLHVMDQNTIMEISTFERKGNSYEASSGNHDDIVMNLVLFGYFATSPEFERLTDINIKKMMFESRIKEIEEDVPVWGYLDDGLDDQAISVEEFFDQEAAWAIPPDYSNDNW